MKNRSLKRVPRIVTIGLLALTASLPSANCQPTPPAESTATDADSSGEAASTHQQLRELRDELIQAINDKDVDALLALLHPNVVLTTQDGHALAAIRGRDGVRDYIERTLTGPNRGVDSLKVQPTVDALTILYNNDTGIAFGSSQDHYRLVDGTEFDMTPRWSATLVKENGTWLVANLQTSSDLFDNPVLAILWRQVILMVVVAGLVGLVLGAVLARLRIFRRAS